MTHPTTLALIATGLAALAVPSRAQVPPAPAAARPSLKQVIVVFKTHFDIGYTDMASNVVQRYRTKMIDDALNVADQSRTLPPEQQFAWTLPGWPLSQIMADWPGQTAERKARVRQAFQEGRFVVHGLPFTTHTELLEPEDLVRGLGFASRLSRAADLSLPRDAKMTDVPCHSWIMPTLLRHAGVEFLHLGCNAASSSPRVPRLFLWEGPDGSRLLTMYTAESYGTGLVPPSDWPYQTWLALVHTGDNHGPPTPTEVKKLLDQAGERLPGVKVRIGRLSDFADGILAEKADIPVVRGDMPDTWIHGPMCDPAGAKIARNIRPAIMATESLNTLAGIWGVGTPKASETIREAWEQSLLYGEHTWGGALYWVTKYSGGAKWGYGDEWRGDHAQGRFQRLEGSWAEHTAYIEKARDLIVPLQEGNLRALAQAVASTGNRVVVFNPLPWKRSGLVAVRDAREAGFAISAATDSKSVPLAEHKDGWTRFVARDVPPMGYATFPALPMGRVQEDLVQVDESAATIATPFFKAVLDPAHGAIRSLKDQRSGHELVDASAAHGFGQYLYERFASNDVARYVKAYVKIRTDWAINELGKPNLPPTEQVPYRAATPANCSLHFDRSPVSVSAIMQSQPDTNLPHAVTTRLILYPDQPYADLEITVHDKAPDPWPEAGWVCLPFQIPSPQFRLGRQASIIDPVNDIVPGANQHLYGVTTGVALFDPQGRGVGVCPIDSPLVSLDQPGCWKYLVDFTPKKPVVYVNLYNNQWTTNFRLWNQGTWTARVRIWSFNRFEAESCLITPAWEARYPLLAALGTEATGTQPATNAGLELSRKGVLVTAFGPNPDGAGLLLRLWEQAGYSGNCQVRLPAGLKAQSAQPVNLRGQPLGRPLPVRAGRFELALRAFAPASFILE